MTTDPMDDRRCTATSRQSGERCKRAAIVGGTVCVMHGGKAPAVAAAAAGRVERANAEVALQVGLAAAYGDRVPDIDPATAMLKAVSWKYVEVVALRAKVAELGDDERVWGKVRDKSGGDDYGITQEARPNVWWVMLRESERDLVKFAAAARAAGATDALIEIEQEKALHVTAAFRGSVSAVGDRLLPADRSLMIRTFLGLLGVGDIDDVVGDVVAGEVEG